jgi:ribosomal protein S18 acetylase RimI-like enzyme
MSGKEQDVLQTAQLVRIDRTLVETASITCARAFAEDPMTVWMIPDAVKRTNMRYAFEMVLRIAAMGGAEAYTTSPDCEGVAVWMPAGKKQSIDMLIKAGYPRLPLRCGWRYFLLDNLTIAHCEKMRKRYAPPVHCYLGLLAVDPEHQGKGLAGALLRPMLSRLNNEKTACYLETQNLKNVSIYQHFGFELVHETHVPGSNLLLYLMLRQAVTPQPQPLANKT